MNKTKNKIELENLANMRLLKTARVEYQKFKTRYMENNILFA